jgi:hypothetical protein
LRYDVKALQIKPYCPLAVWGYAETLDLLKRDKEALQVFRRPISWGEDLLAYGPCGEGIQSARSLIADCLYRIARIQEDVGQKKKAIATYKTHLAKRTRGVRDLPAKRCPEQAPKSRARSLGVPHAKSVRQVPM